MEVSSGLLEGTEKSPLPEAQAFLSPVDAIRVEARSQEGKP